MLNLSLEPKATFIKERLVGKSSPPFFSRPLDGRRQEETDRYTAVCTEGGSRASLAARQRSYSRAALAQSASSCPGML